MRLNWLTLSPGTAIPPVEISVRPSRTAAARCSGEKGYGLGVCGTWEFYVEGGAA